MRLIVIGLLIVAVFIAGMVVFLADSFIDQKTAEVEANLATKTKVLVANVELTIGATIVRDNVRWQPWPEDGIAADYVVEIEGKKVVDKYLGAVVRRPIAAGEPITPARLIKRDAPGFLSAMLPPGKRAAVVKVSDLTSTGGFILPGDRVDLILTHKIYAKEFRRIATGQMASSGVPTDPSIIQRLPDAITSATETILTNLRVIAVDKVLGKIEGSSRASKTVSLEVTPKQLQIIAVGKTMGELSLSLRSIRPGADTDDQNLMIATTDIEVSPLLSRLLRKPEASVASTVDLPSLNVLPPSIFEAELPSPEVEPEVEVEVSEVAEEPVVVEEPEVPVVELGPADPEPEIEVEVVAPTVETVAPPKKKRSIKVYVGGVDDVLEWEAK